MNGFGNRQKQSLFVLLLMIAGMVFVTLRSSDEPEERIRKMIVELVQGAEHKDISPFKEHLSDQFKDEKGRNKQEVLSILRMIYLRHQKISLNIVGMQFQDSTDPSVMELELELLMSETSLPSEHGRFWITLRDRGKGFLVWNVVWEDGYGY